MSNLPPTGPRRFTGPCRFFLESSCNFGENCRFSHDVAAAPANKQQRPPPPPTRGRGSGRRRGRGGRPVPTGNNFPTNMNPTTTGAAQLEMAIKELLVGVKKGKEGEITRRFVEQPPRKEPEESPHQDKLMGGYMAVRFGPGLEILTIQSTDVTSPSAVIEGLPKNTSMQEALTIAREFKPDLPPQAVRTFVRGDKLQAVVNYDDVLVADAAIKALDGRKWKDGTLAARALKPTSASDDVTKIQCSWFQPAKAAYLQFSQQSEVDAAVATAGRIKEIRGQRYKCLPQPPRPGTRSHRVLLVGLDRATTEVDLRGIFTFESLNMKEPKFDVSRDDVVAYVRSLFDGTKITDWKIVSHPADSKQRVLIDVESADHARKFYRENDGKKHGFLGNTTLNINLSYNATFRIPVDIFKAVKEEVVALEVAERTKEREIVRAGKAKEWDAGDDSPARVVIYDRYVPVTVRIFGRGRPAVVRIKTAMQKLLRGEIVCDEDGRAMWNPTLKGIDGHKVMREVKNRTGVHINLDIRSRTMTLYGTQEQRQAARMILAEQYRLLLGQQHDIPLSGQSLWLVHRGGLAGVQKLLGADKVILDLPNRRLTVTCSPAVIEEVKRLLRQPGEIHRYGGVMNGDAATGGGEDDCAACFSPAEQPTKPPCGHVYCKLCASEYINSTIDTSTYPIVCFGNEGNCKTPFPLAFIRSLLTNADMDRHITQSFSSYIQTHPKEYHFCPTPDCGTVYGVTTTGKVFTCSQCFVGICTTCCTETHDNQTCDEFMSATNPEISEQLFQGWRGEHDVKKCPTCKSYVEKNEGCHHMTCKCGQHWCWLCFETFPDGDQTIYAHIESAACVARQRQQTGLPQEPPPPPPPWEYRADFFAELGQEGVARARREDIERIRHIRAAAAEQEDARREMAEQLWARERLRRERIRQADEQAERERRNASGGGFCAIM
ncbi:hypothetical protein BZA05DRAFT_375881 [Tricharina praecox]|uniref:uncharacterized protein n=1 Tax=Tricharina praecox TaxID=43433 RepID=UPI002220AB47|nr:uncharacterized protein BZA05DRAFT_375881 [Tricharina praecox]KAI5848215.1 hypothetical protein BZA05DRAFT_375881 [Tricharina praecox]